LIVLLIANGVGAIQQCKPIENITGLEILTWNICSFMWILHKMYCCSMIVNVLFLIERDWGLEK